MFVSSSVKGVPLAYDSIKIVGQHGDIYDDSGYIHMDIVADFIVFQPKKGQKLLVRFTNTALDRFCYSVAYQVLLSFGMSLASYNSCVNKH